MCTLSVQGEPTSDNGSTDIVVTVLLYRWLFVGSYTPSHKSRAERVTEFVIRVGLAWVFPLIALWLLYAIAMEKLGLFKEKEVAS